MRLCTLLMVLLVIFQLPAQQLVFPGDADNNGLVDHHDILSVGFAFGSLGPPRAPGSVDALQPLVAPWTSAFPGGRNFAYADANGNGLVDLLDFAIVSINQGEMIGASPQEAFTTGEYGVDPSIEINNNVELDQQVVQGTAISLPVHFRNFGADTEVNGLAFSLDFDPDYVSEINFTFSDEWINADSQAFQFKKSETDKIRIAVSRLGANPVNGDGIIGILDVIVVEDLVGLLPNTPNPTPFVTVDNIQVVDGDFNPILTAPHTAHFARNQAVSTDEIPLASQAFQGKIFPNPNNGQFQATANHPFYKIDLLYPNGRSKVLYQGPPRERWRSENDVKLPPGMYYLRLSGEKGLCLLPVVIR